MKCDRNTKAKASDYKENKRRMRDGPQNSLKTPQLSHAIWVMGLSRKAHEVGLRDGYRDGNCYDKKWNDI